MNNEKPSEDYRATWREFYCAVVVGRRGPIISDSVENYAKIADEMLEEYMKRHTKFRELDLKAFK
jgi:hypothetical protein